MRVPSEKFGLMFAETFYTADAEGLRGRTKFAQLIKRAVDVDGAKACNVVSVSEPIKAIDAIRRFECDCHNGLGHGGVEVVSDRMIHGTIVLVMSPTVKNTGAPLHGQGA
jgi:hypothetical protein